MKFKKLSQKLPKFQKSFSMKNKTIFLDPNNPDAYDIADKQRVNIILSPSLYWVKKVSLPVKYIRDAKKLLPSLFEENLPDGNYSYTTYKVNEEFYIFAYEDKNILEAIAKCGIALSNVRGIYFAQSELQNIEGAVNINETQSIYVQDDIVVLVPCCWIEETGNLNLEELKLSKHKINIQQYAHIVDKSSFYKVGAILMVLAILLFSELVITKNKTDEIIEQNDKIFASHKLKPTMMQNKSMLKKYKKIHIKQTKIRAYISYILRFKLRGSEKLSQLNIKDSTLSVEISGATDATLTRMKNMLKSKKVKNKLSIYTKVVKLEVEL